MFDGPRRPSRPTLCFAAALLLLASSAHAQDRDISFSITERPTLRMLVGGGIAIPLSFELGSFGMGGGISLGAEWPQSEHHSLLVRLDYDHFDQDIEGFNVAPGTEAGAANLTLVHGDVRFIRDVRFTRDGGVSGLDSYVEAGLGLAYRSLSDATDYDTVSGTYRRRTDRGVSGAFVLASGTAYHPEEAGLGFFLELQMVFLMRGESINYVPVRVGVTFP